MKKILAILLTFMLTGTLILFGVTFLGRQVIQPAMNEDGARVSDDVIRQEISLYEALIEKNAPNVECLLEDAHDFCGHSDILIAGDRMNETLLDYIDGFLSSQIDLQRDS